MEPTPMQVPPPYQANDTFSRTLSTMKTTLLVLAVIEIAFYVILLCVGVTVVSTIIASDAWRACISWSIIGIIGSGLGIGGAMNPNQCVGIAHMVMCIVSAFAMFVLFCVYATGLGLADLSKERYCEVSGLIYSCEPFHEKLQAMKPYLWIAMIFTVIEGFLNTISASCFCSCFDSPEPAYYGPPPMVVVPVYGYGYQQPPPFMVVQPGQPMPPQPPPAPVQNP